MRISVIGLGKLGSPIVATLAKKGFDVIGVDVNSNSVNEINSGKTHLNEPLLANLIKKYKSKIKATTDITEAIKNTQMTFVIVPTPSQKNGEFSLSFVNLAMQKIGEVLKGKKEFHLILLTSTVMPGSTLKIQSLLEKTSGKVCGKDFGLCYNPEFIALGNVVLGLLNPDFVLIGESDKKSGNQLVSFYKKYCDNKPKFARMNYVNAELAKISFNTFVTTKISYANMIAEICEKLPGANADAVTQAIGLHSVVGGKYIKGGLGFGGPCFPRDNAAFISLAKKIKAPSTIAEGTIKTNQRQLKKLTDAVTKNLKKNWSVGILGLSYKPDTDVIEESHTFLLAQNLVKKGIKINLYDPIALSNVKSKINGKANYSNSAKECIYKSDLVVIGTTWPEFLNLKPNLFKNKTKVLIDPWRLMKKTNFPSTLEYIPFGIHLKNEK